MPIHLHYLGPRERCAGRSSILKASGLIVDFKGVQVRIGSGYSDDQRVEFLDQLPKLIECTFKEITLDGSLREPVFERVRDDKWIVSEE